MPQLTNLEIAKVYEGPNGEGQYGPWQVYNLYFVGGKKKFGYIQSGQKPIPKPGMKVLFLDFEIEKTVKDGKEYINNKIKEIKFEETQQENGIETEKTERKAYIDHGKIVLDLMEKAKYDQNKLFDLIILFKMGINEIIKPLDEPKESQNSSPQEYDEMNPPPPDEDDIPF